MAMKIPDIGLFNLLQLFFVAGTLPIRVHLYSNNFTPVAGSVLSDFTEATFTGYSVVNVSAWGTPTGPDGTGHETISATTAPVFTRSATGTVQNIYGYYVTNQGGGTLLYWAERFASAPFAMQFNGDNITLNTLFTLKSEN
jgi:hypothetical protein